jgi:hypothetical protein
LKAHRIVAIGIIGVAAVAAIAIACTGLNDFQLDSCGNSIIEPDSGEQCDNIPIEGFTCYAKDAGVRGCHVQCGAGGTCPSGWACGGDQICRKPSGTFVASSTIVDDVRSLVIGDFDGDGRKDVLARGTGIVRVHYFDVLGAEITSTVLSVPRGNVMSADLGDGGSSLVVLDSDPAKSGFTVTGTGLDVFRGAANRTLSPVLFQSTPIPGAFDARTFAAKVIVPHPGADEILVYAESTLGPLGILAYFADGGQFFPLGQLFLPHATGATIANDIPVAPIPPGTCDSAVIGYQGSKTVTIVRTCATPTTLNLAPLDVDAGPGPVPPTTFDFLDFIAGPLLVYDTDKDGNLDIVASMASGKVGLLKGDGNGGFVASIPPMSLVTGTLWAIGDVDGDGQTDGIDDDGLRLSKTGERYLAADQVRYAQIRDINNDGFVDGVAMTVNGVDVWLGTGNASPNHRYYNIPSTKLITLGDADGDSNLDIMVASGPDGATLSMLWGNYAAYPNDPVAMGTVGTSKHLASGKFTWFFGEPSDSLSAFVDMTTDPLEVDAGISVVPIRGRADRQLTAPFVLSTGSTLGDRSNPLFGTISAVPNEAGAIVPSVSMAAAKPKSDAGLTALPVTLWTAHGSGTAGVLDPIDVIKPPVDAGTPLVTYPVATIDAGNTLGVTAVDLDPSNKDGDELVLVVPGEQLTIAKRQSFDGGPLVWQQAQAVPFTGTTPDNKPLKVLPGDFDGDGFRDVLVVYGDPTALSAMVYFNDGQGHLVNPTPVPMQNAVAVTTIHALPNATTQVAAVISADSIHLQLFSGPKLVPLPPGSVTLIPNVIDMVAGDVNGDGLEDIVVASATNIEVLLGTVGQ